MLLTFGAAALAFGAVISVLCVSLAVDHFRAQRNARARLARFGLVGADEIGETAAAPTASDLLRQLGSLLSRRTSRARLQELNLRLDQAWIHGRPGAEEFFG